jgi:hypothetical protein
MESNREAPSTHQKALNVNLDMARLQKSARARKNRKSAPIEQPQNTRNEFSSKRHPLRVARNLSRI